MVDYRYSFNVQMLVSVFSLLLLHPATDLHEREDKKRQTAKKIKNKKREKTRLKHVKGIFYYMKVRKATRDIISD